MPKLLVDVEYHFQYDNFKLEYKFGKNKNRKYQKYINKIDPDILMFQEIKCEDDKFPYEFLKK